MERDLAEDLRRQGYTVTEGTETWTQTHSVFYP